VSATPSRRLALTPGEPGGIGPELCVRIAQRDWPAELIAFADPGLLRERAAQLDLPLRLTEYHPAAPPVPQRSGTLTIVPVALATPAQAGQLDPTNANYVLDTLRRASAACLSGELAGLVTGPVHKGVINDAGIAFTGHTEFLANLTGGHPVMMLACPGLRVALATTHLPLAAVPGALDAVTLEQVTRVLVTDLTTRFDCSKPRVLVCGLNPHAGESGYLGREEIEVIIPVLERLRSEGMELVGPLPADTAFTPAALDGVDAVLAMYHDQGLPVLKHLGFGHAVNITLGLPIIRTSVDHGTALDLAGTGTANPGSLVAAVETALEMATTEAATQS